jgi:hypothetical protein
MLENWSLSTVLRGIHRDLGRPQKQMLAITPDVLKAMHSKLDRSQNKNRAFWAACLVGFFTFFRKSTLLPLSADHPRFADLRRSDAAFNANDIIITVKHSKTIQFGERTLQVPVPCVQDSVLCPVTAMKDLWRACPHIPRHAAMFSYELPSRRYTQLTQSVFVHILRSTLSSCGLPPDKFSGYSFHRGGAKFAFSAGVPVEAIKAQGDWKSSAVERYLSPSLDLRRSLAKTVSQALP